MATFLKRVGNVNSIFKCHRFIQLNLLHNGRCLQTLGPRAMQVGPGLSRASSLFPAALRWSPVCSVPRRFNSADTTTVTTATGQVASTSPSDEAFPFSEGYIPEAPPLPESLADPALLQTLNSIGEPTLASLDLCHMTPAGFIQMGLETLHVTCGLPWWGAIIAGTIVLRICVFPLVIFAQRNMANMNNHMPTMTRLQTQFTASRQSGNPMEAAKAGQELMNFMKVNNLNPLKNMFVPMAQVPVFISVFVGLRKMANLPVESMSVGGMWWLTDLTLPDPYYVLPLCTMLTFLITVELGVDGMKASNMGHMMKYGMRAMPFIMFPFIMNFPAALCTYWFTSNAFSLIQVLFLKIPAIRIFFKIPQQVKHDPSVMPKKGFVEGFKDTWDNSKLTAQMEDRARVDAVRFKEAGLGPIQKTFPYDPTKNAARSASTRATSAISPTSTRPTSPVSTKPKS